MHRSRLSPSRSLSRVLDVHSLKHPVGPGLPALLQLREGSTAGDTREVLLRNRGKAGRAICCRVPPFRPALLSFTVSVSLSYFSRDLGFVSIRRPGRRFGSLSKRARVLIGGQCCRRCCTVRRKWSCSAYRYRICPAIASITVE